MMALALNNRRMLKQNYQAKRIYACLCVTVFSEANVERISFFLKKKERKIKKRYLTKKNEIQQKMNPISFFSETRTSVHQPDSHVVPKSNGDRAQSGGAVE